MANGDGVLPDKQQRESIVVSGAASDSAEWAWVYPGFPFTIQAGSFWRPILRFSPRSPGGVSQATFTVYSNTADGPHRFTVYGARVSTTSPVTTVLSLTSIKQPAYLRLNPVRDELYALGWAGSAGDDPQGKYIVRVSTTARHETGVIEFPDIVRDYGVTQDGRWLYAATDWALYTVDLNTLQIVDSFVPTDVIPWNATLYTVGVFSSTLVFVGTNPGFATGGPIYQWNPQTDSWTPVPLCPADTARPSLEVSADYTTVAGLCEPYFGPTTAFMYRLGQTTKTWASEERWRACVSRDGQRLVSKFYGNNWTGSLIANEQGNSGNLYIHTTEPNLFSLVFGSAAWAYGAVDTARLVIEVDTQRGIQTRAIAVPQRTSSGDYSYIPSEDGLAMRGDWLYVALWGDFDGKRQGEVIALHVPPPVSPPSSQVGGLPAFSPRVFTVHWSGTPSASGLRSYDVQYRDGTGGVWTDWLLDTSQTSAVFAGEYGHTYYFRCRVRDYTDNVEAYPGGGGDTSTHLYRYALGGHVVGNREQPVALATAQALPSGLNMSQSGINGAFYLYFDQEGSYDIEVDRDGFAALPPIKHLLVTDTVEPITFYLPPLDDRVVAGGFEPGNPVAWTFYGDVTATVTTTAHTGDQAILLGGAIPPGAPVLGPWRSVIEQDVILSSTLLTSGTLSLLYQVVAAEPNSDTVQVDLVGLTQSVTHTLPLTGSGWLHSWWEIPAWESPTMTLRVAFEQGGDRARQVEILLDEISLGSSVRGSYPGYLPLILRNGP
jgi:hypothetical protein